MMPLRGCVERRHLFPGLGRGLRSWKMFFGLPPRHSSSTLVTEIQILYMSCGRMRGLRGRQFHLFYISLCLSSNMWIAFLFLIHGFCITGELPDCLKKIKKEICCLVLLLLWECLFECLYGNVFSPLS